MTFGFLVGSKNFGSSFSFLIFLVLHGYDWIHWVARPCTTKAYRWLFRDSPSFVEDFVIGCYQVTELFCSTYWFASAPSARSLHNFGSQAYFAISVFWEVSKDTVHPCFWYHFRRTFRIWVQRNVCGHGRLCALTQPFRKISQTVVRISTVILLVILFLIFGAPNFLVHVSHFVLYLDLLMTSPVKMMLKANFLPLLDDTPGATRGTNLSVLHKMFFSFFFSPTVVADRWPTHMNIRVLHEAFLCVIMGEPRTDGDSQNKLKSFTRLSSDLPSPINCWFRSTSFKAIPSDRMWKSSWSAMNLVPPFLHWVRQFAPPRVHMRFRRSSLLRTSAWPLSTMSPCSYLLTPAPAVLEHKRSTPRCYLQGKHHTALSASTSRWTPHKHRTPSSKATVTSMWPSNVLRAVVVLLWALPTLRAAECVALNTTESAAKDGRVASTASQELRGEGLF